MYESRKKIVKQKDINVSQNKTKSTVQLKDNRHMNTPFKAGGDPVQMAGGKKHHDPSKKKYLSKGISAKQVWVSKRALELIKTGIPRKAATRQAKDEYDG